MPDAKADSRADVIRQIKQWIASGELGFGQAMPPERALCSRLSVQRMTIRGALGVLEKEGVIARVGPKSRIVAEPRRQALEHSILIVNSVEYDNISQSHSMPGWTVRMASGAVSEVSKNCHNVMLIHPERVTEHDLEGLMKGHPAGVVFPDMAGTIFHPREQWMAQLHTAGVPIVVYGNSQSEAMYDRVISDHAAGAYKLTRYLLERGCKHIVNLYSGEYWAAARVSGYERAMREAGLEPLPTLALKVKAVGELLYPLLSSDPDEYFDMMRNYMVSQLVQHMDLKSGKAPFDAILALSDGNLTSISAACRTLGLVPGKDVLLAGYDNYWAECWEQKCEKVTPVATVDKQNELTGRLMVRLVLDRGRGLLPPEPQLRMIEPELVIPGN